MKIAARVLSAVGLLLTVAPSAGVFLGALDLDTAKALMLAGTVIWFVATPSWMGAGTPQEGE